jgi:DNA-binding CsgD family transcriptional regulator
MFSAISQSAESRLTKREREILDLAHLTYRAIGVELGIASGTVKAHMERIRIKLGADSSRHAVLLWSLRREPGREIATAAPAALRGSA